MGNTLSTDERLAVLERSNHRLKTLISTVGICAIVFGVLGAASPPPRVITATKFVLNDDTGKERAELSSNANAAALQFLNTNGTRAVILTSGSTTNGVLFFDKNGMTRQAITVDQNEAAYRIVNERRASTPLFQLTDQAQGTVLSISDSAAHELIDIGNSPQGAMMSITDVNNRLRVALANQGVSAFDESGKLYWASLGETMTPDERKRVMDLINSKVPNSK